MCQTKIVTLTQAEKKLGAATNWAGRCFEIATTFVDHKLVKGRAVYGHWLGGAVPESYFGRLSRTQLFWRHGWVVLEDGRILDPTRWAFTGEAPFLYVGEPSKEYDEGGNQWREALLTPCPDFDEDEPTFYADLKIVSSQTWSHIENLMGAAATAFLKPGWLCKSQVFWLANLPIHKLKPHAEEVYAFVEKTFGRSIVPIDNWRAVMPERKK